MSDLNAFVWVSAMTRAGESRLCKILLKSAREGPCMKLQAGRGIQFRERQIVFFLNVDNVAPVSDVAHCKHLAGY